MIRHISRDVPLAEVEPGLDVEGVRYALADRHEVDVLFSSAWPGLGRCDSCGRIVVRGMGRWWDKRVWA